MNGIWRRWTSAEASLSSAQANANLARENMIKAEKDYERTKELFDRKLESQSVLDTVYAAAEVEKARYQSVLDQGEQAKAALRQSRDDLAKTTIYAPMSGTVSSLNKEVGEIALGSQFQEDVILEISNLEGMEALVDIDENDIVSVAIGDEAEIEVDALPDVKLKGEGDRDRQQRQVLRRGHDRREDRVRGQGRPSSTRIRAAARDDGVGGDRHRGLRRLSERADPERRVRTLEQLGAEPAAEGEEPEFTPDREGFVEIVWVVVDGRAQARQVKTGIQSETHIEIVEGLGEDDQVVIGNYRAISRDLMDNAVVAVGGEREG